ncbi:hypothetical protein ES705_02054 [subsurface metagenome]
MPALLSTFNCHSSNARSKSGPVPLTDTLLVTSLACLALFNSSTLSSANSSMVSDVISSTSDSPLPKMAVLISGSVSTEGGQSFGSLSQTARATSASIILSKAPERKKSLQSSPEIISETVSSFTSYRKTKGRFSFFILTTPKTNASLSLVKTTEKNSTLSITSVDLPRARSSSFQSLISCRDALSISSGLN